MKQSHWRDRWIQTEYIRADVTITRLASLPLWDSLTFGPDWNKDLPVSTFGVPLGSDCKPLSQSLLFLGRDGDRVELCRSDSQAQVLENEKRKKNWLSVRGVDRGRVYINMCHTAVNPQERAESCRGKPHCTPRFGKLWAIWESLTYI